MVIFLATIVAMLPTFISKLEDDSKRKIEGGTSGVWRILWPILAVVGSVNLPTFIDTHINYYSPAKHE